MNTIILIVEIGYRPYIMSFSLFLMVKLAPKSMIMLGYIDFEEHLLLKKCQNQLGRPPSPIKAMFFRFFSCPVFPYSVYSSYLHRGSWRSFPYDGQTGHIAGDKRLALVEPQSNHDLDAEDCKQ